MGESVPLIFYRRYTSKLVPIRQALNNRLTAMATKLKKFLLRYYPPGGCLDGQCASHSCLKRSGLRPETAYTCAYRNHLAIRA